MDLSYTLLGVVVGILVGITGVGGGSLVTPALTLFGIHPVVAVGTDLAFAGITKTFGTIVHRSRDSVDWRIAQLLVFGSCPAAAITIGVLAATGSHVNGGLINMVLAVAVVLTAVVLLAGRRTVVRIAMRYEKYIANHRAPLTIAAGVLLGVLVTLSSIGAGALGATFLIALYPRLSPTRIAGTDIAHAVPLTTIAGLGHFWLGNVDVLLLASLLMGSVPGIVLGSYASGRFPDYIVRRLLATVLLMVGVRIIVFV
jgi:uncharacterized membrane protein YfcA